MPKPSLQAFRKPTGLLVASTTDRRERENRASNRGSEFRAGHAWAGHGVPLPALPGQKNVARAIDFSTAQR